MKPMKVCRQFKQLAQLNLKNVVATIGNFDGVHKGHQKIIKTLVRKAKKVNGHSVVFTYGKHPLKVLKPHLKQFPLLMTPLKQKLALFEELGVSVVMVIPFSRAFSKLSADDFIQKKVCPSVPVSEFCVGEDTSFGKGAHGDIRHIRKIGKKAGFSVSVVRKVTAGKKVISSTRIRKLIQNGEMSRVSRLLGRPYSVYGNVVKGSALGRQIGFPTANIRPEHSLLPQKGVYAAQLKWNHRWHGGVLNLGHRPTLKTQKSRNVVLEVHLFDFSRTLYRHPVEIRFLRKIRDEKKFSSLEQLKSRIQKDVVAAKRVLRAVNST